MSGRPPRFFRGLQLRLQDAPPGTGVEVEYFMEAARWVPTYTLRLDGGVAALTLGALVAQATGEAWDGVALQFSTADLNRDATLPEVTSWRLGRAQAERKPAFRPLPKDLHELFGGHDRFRQAPVDSLSSMVLGGAVGSIQDVEKDEGGDDFDEDNPTGEVALDELSAAPSMDLGDGAMMDRKRMEAPAAKSFGAMAVARSAAAPMQSARGGGGGRAPGAAPRPKPASPPEPLPPRLRYAWLRLAGADEGTRGTLQPMDRLHPALVLAAG